MAKLPVKLKALLDATQNESIPNVASHIVRINDNDDHLPKWISEKGAAFYEGMLEGQYMMIERSLSAYNAYNGFMEKESVIKVGKREYTFKYNSYCF